MPSISKEGSNKLRMR